MGPHQDHSQTYCEKNPIASLSYGRGYMLTIQNSLQLAKQQTALYYQCPGDAIIMSGRFNEKFWHGMPPIEDWNELCKKKNIVRPLPDHERLEAATLMDGVEMDHDRYNVTIRWHEKHQAGCKYVCHW